MILLNLIDVESEPNWFASNTCGKITISSRYVTVIRFRDREILSLDFNPTHETNKSLQYYKIPSDASSCLQEHGDRWNQSCNGQETQFQDQARFKTLDFNQEL